MYLFNDIFELRSFYIALIIFRFPSIRINNVPFPISLHKKVEGGELASL